jgi:hypothetical protein
MTMVTFFVEEYRWVQYMGYEEDKEIANEKGEEANDAKRRSRKNAA